MGGVGDVEWVGRWGWMTGGYKDVMLWLHEGVAGKKLWRNGGKLTTTCHRKRPPLCFMNWVHVWGCTCKYMNKNQTQFQWIWYNRLLVFGVFIRIYVHLTLFVLQGGLVPSQRIQLQQGIVLAVKQQKQLNKLIFSCTRSSFCLLNLLLVLLLSQVSTGS